MSIRSKIISTVSLVAVVSLSLLVGITMLSMHSLRKNVVELSDTLGTTAGINSHNAVESQILNHLSDLAQTKAEITDERMLRKQQHVEITVDYISNMYNNPEYYKNQTKHKRDQPVAGGYNAQLMYGPGFDPVSASKEYNLVSNAGDFLLLFLQNDTEIPGNYFASESGLLINTSDSSKKKTVYDPHTRPWYQKAVTEKQLIWTDVYDDIHGLGLMITCAAPIYNSDNKLVGVVGFDALMETLTEEIIETKIGKTGYAVVINEYGETIISPNIKKEDDGKIIRRNLEDFKDPEFQKVTKKILAREIGVGQVLLDGHQTYMAYHPMETLPWSVVTVIIVDEVIAPAIANQEQIVSLTNTTIKSIDDSIKKTSTAIFIVVIIALIMVILSSILLAERLTHPLSILTKGVRNISEGDLESVLEVTTKDEIGTLAYSFNVMTRNLKNYITDLTNITAEKERIGAELNIATQIQGSMLPCIFPAFPDKIEFNIHALMHPAKEVGGDFYDFFLTDSNHLAIVIADVAGKGVPAALFMVITKTLIKNHAQAGESPAEIFTNTNRQLCENNEADMFVTAWMGILELDTGKFIYANAGHNPPLLKKANGQFEYLKSRPGFVLAGLEGLQYKQNEIYLDKNDVLFLYTDGVTEATNEENQLYSEKKLMNLLNKSKQTEPKEILKTVSTDINNFVKTAPQFDDITMLAIKINTKMDSNSDHNIDPHTDIILENAKTITLPAILDEIPNIVEFIGTCLDEYDIALKVKIQLDIAIDEIYSNIAKFAYTDSPGKATISCIADKENNRLQLIFMDKGLPYNPLEADDPDITLSADEREVGGLGLFMVKKIMDHITYEYKNHTNILIVEKHNLFNLKETTGVPAEQKVEM